MIFKEVNRPVINKSKGIEISKSYILCENFISKTIGVMFKRKVNKPYIFLFKKETKSSFHTFFCFVNLDIIFLNANKRVVEVFKNIKPFNIIKPKKYYKYVIELSSNKNLDIDDGDLIEF